MARLLLDENFPLGALPGLQSAGHDVLSVALSSPGLDDRQVLALAREQDRMLLTFDADFGDLLYARGAPPPPGLLLFRLHPVQVAETLQCALAALAQVGPGQFAVITREAIRLRPLSSDPDVGSA